MAEWGYGNPVPPGSWLDDPDFGWGSPTPPAWVGDYLDGGYGSPGPLYGDGSPAPYLFPQVVPDEGGILVTVVVTAVGEDPYRIRLYDAVGTAYPVSDFAYGAVPGGGTVVYPPFDKVSPPSSVGLVFTVPPLNQGLYDVGVEYGAGFGQEILIEGGLKVVRRMRCAETYRIRNRLQPVFATGPRSLFQEPILE